MRHSAQLAMDGPADELEDAVHSANRWIRLGAAQHPEVSLDLLELLAEDHEPLVADAALSRLRDRT